jgi:hypothetical protein
MGTRLILGRVAVAKVAMDAHSGSQLETEERLY